MSAVVRELLRHLEEDGWSGALAEDGYRLAIHPIDRRFQHEPKTICVDFDLTLAETKYPEIIGPKPGARAAMQAFRDMGYYIVVSSCRASSYHWGIYYGEGPYQPPRHREVFTAMKEFLKANEIPYDEIDDGTNGKVSAKFYIDDKGVRYEENWPEIVEFVRSKS